MHRRQRDGEKTLGGGGAPGLWGEYSNFNIFLGYNYYVFFCTNFMLRITSAVILHHKSQREINHNECNTEIIPNHNIITVMLSHLQQLQGNKKDASQV